MSPRRALALAALPFALTAGLAAPAGAHRLAPSYLELREERGGSVRARWRTPRVVVRGARLEPRLSCPAVGEPALRQEATAWVERWEIRCPAGLTGTEVSVDGLAESGTDAIVHVVLADGRELRKILTGREPRFRVPVRESRLEVAGSYLRLGARHLGVGLDHLLFVCGLLLVLRSGRQVLLAVTAFSAGHSLTLALAALGFARLPQTPVEVAIAGSLVVLGLEIDRTRGGAPSPLVRHPGLLPLTFGLLHGLGFAASLSEIGLPGHAIPLALGAFNIGIELGQLAIVALALPLVVAARRTPFSWPRAVAELPATAIGSLGVYWFLERSLGWLVDTAR